MSTDAVTPAAVPAPQTSRVGTMGFAVGLAIVAVVAARKGKPYIYGLAFTFGAYVLYDLARLLQWDVQGGLLSGLFLLATITALIAVWGLYRD